MWNFPDKAWCFQRDQQAQQYDIVFPKGKRMGACPMSRTISSRGISSPGNLFFPDIGTSEKAGQMTAGKRMGACLSVQQVHCIRKSSLCQDVNCSSGRDAPEIGKSRFSDFRKSGVSEIRKSGNLKIRISGFPEIRIWGNRISEIPENPKIRISGYSHVPDFRKSENPKIR